MSIKIKILILFFFFCASVFGQKYSLGKVTVEELAEKVHPLDSSAVAAYLFKTGKVSFEYSPFGFFLLVQEVKCKIKIYKKEGYPFANVEIPYYSGGFQMQMVSEDAVTYNLVNNKVQRTKVKSNAEFDEDVDGGYTIRKITFPNVREGSIVEYSYTYRTPFYSNFPAWYFQHSIPTNKSQYIVSIPPYFGYKRFLKGFESIKESPQQIIKSRGGYEETRVVYDASDLKAIKQESYVNNVDNYISMVEFELSSTNLPNEGLKHYSTDWESLAKTIYDSEYFGEELNKSSYFESDLDTVLKGVVEQDAKMNAIFNYVKSRMNWNGRNGYRINLGVENAYAEKAGNVADINLMLIAMLRKAKIKCNPILVSTRSNGISIFPSFGAFNYVIAGVEFDNKMLLLDATSKFSLPNILPIKILNWTGRMIRPDKTSAEVDLIPKFNSKETVTVMANIDTNGKVSGKVRDQYYDYNNYVFREVYSVKSKDFYLEKLEKDSPGLYVSEYELINENDLNKPITEVYNFLTDNLAERIGEKIYFSPMLFFAETTNPFKEEARLYPVDFAFPYQDKYNFTINIPDDYKIEFLPKPLSITIEDNIGTFKFNIVSSGNQIQVMVVLEMNHSSIEPEFYNSLKSFYKEMISKQTEKIVLKKI